MRNVKCVTDAENSNPLLSRMNACFRPFSTRTWTQTWTQQRWVTENTLPAAT